MTAVAAPWRMRAGFRRAARVCVVLLLPIAAHALWDYIESRRLLAAVDDLRQRGEPVSRDALGRWRRPTDQQQIRAARYYNAAGELAFRDWTLPHPAAELPDQQPIRRARRDFAAVAQSRFLAPDIASRFEGLQREYAESLEMMDRGAALPFSSFPPHGFEDYPRTYSLEDLSLVGSARTLLLAFRGDGDGAARALWSALRLRRAHTRTLPWIPEPLLDIQVLLERSRPSTAMLEQLQDAFRERERPDAVERDLRERRAILIESTFTEWYGRRADPLVPAMHARWSWRPSTPLRPVAAHLVTRTLRLTQEAVGAAVQPFPDKLLALAAVAEKQGGPPRATGKVSILDYGRVIVHAIATEEAPRAAVALAHVRSAIVVLASERFRRDHGGSAPAALSDLVPAYLDAVAVDPFTGQLLRYRKDATRLVVYSVGPDGKDDGGDVGTAPVIASKVGPKDVGLEVRVLTSRK